VLKLQVFEEMMLQIKDLGKAYRGEWLFRSLDFQINEKDRIGLVGENGTGKSTLMKMLSGLIAPDEGGVIGSKQLSFGYLPQDGLFVQGRTLFEEALSVFEGLLDLERECRSLEAELSEMEHSGADYEKKLERYSSVSQQFRMLGGYTLEAQVGTVLHGLGFSQSDFQRRCEEFSGGWQMRIALAKLLLQQPSLLLLDEPTNHLDLEARNWLEEYLQQYPYALVLVSHDRFFLDSTVTRILEIRNRGVHFYKGNYQEFEKQREERIAQLVAAREAQDREIARIKVFADKFRYKATKAAQVQSRLKELEKMERIELPPESKHIHFRFPEGPRTGRVVLELADATAGYGDVPVLRDLNLRVERTERIALVGPNGAGKSTLMKVLAGRLALSAGARIEGQNAAVAYFSQDQDGLLSGTNTVWEEVYSVAPSYIVPELRNLLGCFLFSGDTVEKPVSVLSGGERSRLLLCKLLLSPANCLLLDEPTNHLDLRSKDVLMESLREYGGTLIFVSHDRYFLNGLATKILEVGHGTAIPYIGNYEDYLYKKKAEQAQPSGNGAQERAAKTAPVAEESAAPALKKKKVNPYKIQQLTDIIERLESSIHSHETRVAVLSQMLASSELYRDQQLFRNTLEEHDRLQEELTSFMEEWEKLQTELADMQS
jgi:ATP-binding cassette, subfamily F, member 3